MKLVKYFDIHDKEVTPVVYTLFFALQELKGNDMVYTCYIEAWNTDDAPRQRWSDDHYNQLNEFYQERLDRGPENCFHNRESMSEFHKNPPAIQEAMKQCWTWLKEQGITEDDETFFVKIWW